MRQVLNEALRGGVASLTGVGGPGGVLKDAVAAVELLASLCEHMPGACDRLAADLMTQSLVNLLNAAGLANTVSSALAAYGSARELLRKSDRELERQGFSPSDVRNLRLAANDPMYMELARPLHTVRDRQTDRQTDRLTD